MLNWAFPFRFPGLHEKCSHGTRQVNGQFGMAGIGLHEGLPFAVSIAKRIAYGSDSFHDGSATAQDLPKDEFCLFARSQLKTLCCQFIQFWKIGMFLILDPSGI